MTNYKNRGFRIDNNNWLFGKSFRNAIYRFANIRQKLTFSSGIPNLLVLRFSDSWFSGWKNMNIDQIEDIEAWQFARVI